MVLPQLLLWVFLIVAFSTPTPSQAVATTTTTILVHLDGYYFQDMNAANECSALVDQINAHLQSEHEEVHCVAQKLKSASQGSKMWYHDFLSVVVACDGGDRLSLETALDMLRSLLVSQHMCFDHHCLRILRVTQDSVIIDSSSSEDADLASVDDVTRDEVDDDEDEEEEEITSFPQNDYAAASSTSFSARRRRHLFAASAQQRRRSGESQGGQHVSPIDAFHAEVIWKRFPQAQGQLARVGIFDTGLSRKNPHFDHAVIAYCVSFTNERRRGGGGGDGSGDCEDGHGHGTFGASLIVGGESNGEDALQPRAHGGCRQFEYDDTLQRDDELLRRSYYGVGLAPKAALHVFKVFTNKQLSLTSWFLAAFNVAMQMRLDVINLSFGSMDYYDEAFVDKIREVAAAGIAIVTATGNDGPRQGSVYNPADQPEVISVGSVDGPQPTRVSKFSSRGATSWELPYGVGRPRPDVVTYGEDVVGAGYPTNRRACRLLSGTSVASPVVVGVLAMVVSVLRGEDAAFPITVAVLKHILTHTADPLIPQWLRQREAEKMQHGALHLDEGDDDDNDNKRFSILLQQISTWRDYSIYSQGAGVVNATRAVERAIEIVNEAKKNKKTSNEGQASTITSPSPRGGGSSNGEAATIDFAHPRRMSSLSIEQRVQHLKQQRSSSSLSKEEAEEAEHLFLFGWPHMLQSLFYSSSPVIFNVTLYHSFGSRVSGSVVRLDTNKSFVSCRSPKKADCGGTMEDLNRLMDVVVDVTQISQHSVSSFATVIFVAKEGAQRVRYASAVYGDIVFTIMATTSASPSSSVITVPFDIHLTSVPPRHRRLLWDTTHNLYYPSLFIPRDDIRSLLTPDFADWGGDHPHTNYYALYEFLVRDLGLFVDFVHDPQMVVQCDRRRTLCSLDKYDLLLIVDPEEYFPTEYVQAVSTAVKHRALKVIVCTDWYHEGVMLQSSFTDVATGVHWVPVTGGCNVAAVNSLLRPFGLAQRDDCQVSGPLMGGGHRRFGQLISAGCIDYTGGGDVVSMDDDTRSTTFVCRPMPYVEAAKHDDGLATARAGGGGGDEERFHDEIAEFKSMLRTKGARELPSLFFDRSDVPNVFAVVLFDDEANRTERGISSHRRAKILVADDSDYGHNSNDENRGGVSGGGGGGVFMFTDSNCLDAMQHYSGGEVNSAHQYCFAFLREAIRVLQRKVRIAVPDDFGTTRRDKSTSSSLSLSALSDNCAMASTDRRLLVVNRTWENVDNMTLSMRKHDPLYRISRRYRRDRQQQQGVSALHHDQRRYAVEDRLSILLKPYFSNIGGDLGAVLVSDQEEARDWSPDSREPRSSALGHGSVHSWRRRVIAMCSVVMFVVVVMCLARLHMVRKRATGFGSSKPIKRVFAASINTASGGTNHRSNRPSCSVVVNGESISSGQLVPSPHTSGDTAVASTTTTSSSSWLHLPTAMFPRAGSGTVSRAAAQQRRTTASTTGINSFSLVVDSAAPAEQSGGCKASAIV